MGLLAPSILSADFGNLQRDFDMINQSEADWFHVDIMDGVFVPNISFGFPIMAVLKEHAKKPLDVHLMIENPGTYVEEFAKYGTDTLGVHVEACTHIHRVIGQIKDAGMKASATLNPGTSVEVLRPLLSELDMVLLMSVNPGFGGQKFLPLVYDKIKAVRDMAGSDLLIEVDGGVNLDNCQRLSETGADVLVAGSAIFKGNPKENIKAFKSRIG